MKTQVIAVANQKGGVGKTTTAVHLAHGLSLLNPELKVLLIDLNPQGHVAPSFGIKTNKEKPTIADLIKNRDLPTEAAIYSGGGIDVIPANTQLSSVEREMVGRTNSELYLAKRLELLGEKYSIIILDTTPTFGPLINSAFNAARHIIVPVQVGIYSLVGVKELLAQTQDIRLYTNSDLKILGYLMTFAENTNITEQVWEGLKSAFGDEVFKTPIRKRVKVTEAPGFGKTVFQYAPESEAARDYLTFCIEVMERLNLQNAYERSPDVVTPPLSTGREVCHE